IDRNGKVIQQSGNPTFGFGVDPSQPRFNPLDLTDGRWASGADDVVIDNETAANHHFAVGDAIKVAGQGPAQAYHIVGIALFRGAFVIFNTMSITVAQRTRELATLRTLGATRRQVLRSVVLESFALGIVASVVGLFTGIGLARGLSSLFSALGLSLPEASPVYGVRTFVVSLVLGLVVT